MKHTEWKQYMHDTAERCRRQLKVAERARGRPRVTSFEPYRCQRDAMEALTGNRAKFIIVDEISDFKEHTNDPHTD